MSRGLALGAIAALAGLAAVRSRSGSRSKLRPVPEGFSTSSYLAVRGTVLEDYLNEIEEDEEPDEEKRLYHVTTAATRVLEQGLKSRSRLKQQRGAERSYGLGGGLWDYAPDKISTTIKLSHAQHLKHAIVTAILAAQGKILPSEAAIECLRWTEFPLGWHDVKNALQDRADYDEDGDLWERGLNSLTEALGIDKDVPPTRWAETIKANPGLVDRGWRMEGGAYLLIVEIEKILHDTILAAEYDYDEDRPCLTIGFTEPWFRMAQMDPEEVKILAVAVRGQADDVVPSEMEARFIPENVVVLGVEE